ncbi:trimeric intracellular cation channel type 1B.1 [Drosophila nasuta]|uniref:trimeric intracellular cation channel type 1B.1 n=1 Tax=Drosophila nasuta TaxID=42062 RepID=UPI00295E8D64|nr:trimeric intracellular cation channel type 1B.1 [Drosophila nasuta]
MNSPNILRPFSNHFIFRALHYTFIAFQLRDELMRSNPSKQRPRSYLEWQPFVLWLNHVMLTYAGDILVNVMLGSLPLEPLSNVHDVILCTLTWYLIFYSPFDWAHAVARTVAFRMLATPITAISQVVHIDRGIQLAGKMYGNNALVPILIIGTIVGSGAEFLKPVAALLINRCQLTNAAYVKLSTNSKVSFCIALVFVLQLNQSQWLFGLSRRQLHIYVLIVLILFKYLSMACRMDHLIWKLEKHLCYAFFGGLSADLAKFFKCPAHFENLFKTAKLQHLLHNHRA